MRMVKWWNRLPREVANDPALALFKALSKLVSWEVSLPAYGGGIGTR